MSKILREDVLPRLVKDIIIELLGDRPMTYRNTDHDFSVIKEEIVKLQPKKTRFYGIVQSLTEGIYIKVPYAEELSEKSDTRILIYGGLTYNETNYSISSEILVLPDASTDQYLKPVCVFASEDIKNLLEEFNYNLIKIEGDYFIKITFPLATPELDEVQDLRLLVDNYNGGISFDKTSGDEEILFTHNKIKFGAVSDQDPILDSGRLVRSDEVREIVNITQDRYDELVESNQTKNSELYLITESYIDDPTNPPTQPPTPSRVTLNVVWNDSFIWVKDYEKDAIVEESFINLNPITGYNFKEFRDKPLTDPSSKPLVFPIRMDETKVIYANYVKQSTINAIVWDGGSQVLSEKVTTGDEWDPRLRVPARDKFYPKYYNESAFTTPTIFPIEVADVDINVYSKWIKGYYFPTLDDFNSRIDAIIADNNGMLGEYTFEFADEVTSLDYLFFQKPIKQTPKIIISKATTARYTFSECSQLVTVSNTIYGGALFIENLTGSFKNSDKITSSLPTLWESFADAVGTECFTGCINAINYPDVPIPWGGMLMRTITVRNYVDDSLVKTLKLADGVMYDLMKISETYDNTGTWGAFFTDKQRTTRIYDPVLIREDATYYAEFCSFDYYFDSVEDFTTNIGSVVTENNGDLSNKVIGFAPTINKISVETTQPTLTSLPKHIWVNIDSQNAEGSMGVKFIGDSIRNVPSTYLYFMTRMKIMNGMVKTANSSTRSNVNLLPTELFKHTIYLNTITDLIEFTGNSSNGEIMPLPGTLFDTLSNLSIIDGFLINAPVESIPSTLFANNTQLFRAKRLFKKSRVKSIPNNLFDPCGSLADLTEAFNYCTHLIGNAPVLWDRDPAIETGTDCFTECRGLTNFNDIPIEWGGDPITTKDVTVKYNANITGGFISGPGVSGNPNTFNKVETVQLEDNKLLLPAIVGNYANARFLGWSLSSTDKSVLYNTGSTIIVEGTEITLYAWYESTINITYKGNGHGTFTGSVTEKVVSHTINPNRANEVTVQTPDGFNVESGFEFKEWNDNASGSGTGYANGSKITSATTNLNRVLYAIYIDRRQTVTFKSPTNITAEGGSPSTTVAIKKPKPFVIPTISVANYVVNGHSGVYQFFATATNGTTPTTQYKQGSTVPETVSTLNAWFKVASLRINLNLNYSGSSAMSETWTDLYTNNDATTAHRITKVPTRNGYIFKGWSTSASGSVQYQSNVDITGVLTKFTQNTTLYAIWEGEPVTVQYNLDGGTIDGQSTLTVQAKVGDTITIVNKTPIKDGYTFVNYSDKTGKTYNPGDPMVVSLDKLQ